MKLSALSRKKRKIMKLSYIWRIFIILHNIKNDQRAATATMKQICQYLAYLDCCSFIIFISFDVFQFPYRDARMLWGGIVDSKPPDNTENQTQSSTNVEYTRPSSIKPLPLTEVTSNTQYQYTT